MVSLGAPATPGRALPTLGYALRTLVITCLCAAASGLVVGGVLGRLAMRLLALTSPDIAQGRLTDDAARVGEFSLSGSLTLAIALAIGSGLVVGPTYLLARRILPASRSLRVLGFALLTGSVGGALFVHDHPSFDYSILQPTWLAVVLFVLLPAATGGLTALLAEWLSPARAPSSTSAVARLWHSTAVTRLGVAVYWIVVAWGIYNVGADIVSVATDRASTAPFTV